MKINLCTISTVFFLSICHLYLVAQTSNSLYFDGQDDYVVVADSPLNSIGTGNFTFEAWIQGDANAQNSHPTIFSSRGTNPSGGGVMFFLHNQWGGSLYKLLSVQVDEFNYKIVNNGSFNGTVLDNTCHHIAITRGNGQISFYIDGLLFGAVNIVTAGFVNLDQPFRIGQDRATNNTFNGLISQVRIWNVARTEAEIQESMGISIAGDTPGLLAYWEMTDGDGQIITDKTGQYNAQVGNSSSPDLQDPVWSDQGCMVTSSTDDILSTSFDLYPNPTTDQIFIEFEEALPLQVEVYNSVGQRIYSAATNDFKTTIDLANYPVGIYIVKLINDGKIASRKVIKN